MELLCKLMNFIKKHLLDVITLATTILGIITYLIGFRYFSEGRTTEQIFSLTVDYVTICSCALVLIQLIAFVKDARSKENRCRKEAALDLAKHYAENILTDITFIENVLSRHYNNKDVKAYAKMVSSLEITTFKKEKLNEKFKAITDIFDKNNAIKFDLLTEQAIVFQKMDIDSIEKVDKAKQLEMLNRRFKKEICDTMNTLEYFAMSMNQNIAESDMLYPSLHQTYLKFVRFMYPYICFSNVKKEEFYTNIIELYRNWEKKEKELNKYDERSEKRREADNKRRSRSRPL